MNKTASLVGISWFLTALVSIWFGAVGFSVLQNSNPPIPSGGKISQAEQCPSESHQTKAKIEERGSDASPLVIHVKKTIEDRKAAENDERRAEQNTHTQSMQAMFNGWLCFLGLIQLVILYIQSRIMSGQKDAQHKSLRAYMVLVVGKDFVLPKQNYLLRISAKNCGQTPALNARVFLERKIFQGSGVKWPKEIPLPIHWSDKPGSRHPVASGATNDFDVVISDLSSDFRNEIILDSGLQISLYYFGCIEYFDIFEERHETRFCLKHFEGGGINDYYFHSEHNECT